MTRNAIGLLALGFAAGAALFSTNLLQPATAQDHGNSNAQSGGHDMDPAQMGEMMEKWDEYMKLGEPHQRMAKGAGTWNLTVKMWWMDPNGDPMVSKGTATRKMILDGHYMLETMKTTMTMPGPDGQMQSMPFEGMSLGGYDNYRKVYFSTWCDSMTTGFSKSTGTYNPQQKKYYFYGEMDEPMLGVTGRMVKSVITIVNDDKEIFEMYDLHVAPDYKVMEIVYERQK